ncbi:MAG: MotA/TolQ/ExbB proton channel family protein [Prevotellaceae bacterium]|nr:MotA/TolQ/ExbB proton channel family protein [Prevotellaceae bacterium]
MIVIVVCAIVAHLFFYLFCGADARFDDKGHPIDGNIFGTLYQGGFVIPIVITLLLTVLALGVERFFALNKASGRGSITKFVAESKAKLKAGDIDGAEQLCNKQKGSVANILRAGLVRYRDVEQMAGLSNDEKATIIEKEIEDATALELPYLEQNLNVIATISSLGTLFGLLGTVLGMIRSFGAMANEGAPDSIALSLGISEALMNTAMGIATGALAIIVYNFFAAKVQDITNAVGEVGFAVGQTYATKHEKQA